MGVGVRCWEGSPGQGCSCQVGREDFAYEAKAMMWGGGASVFHRAPNPHPYMPTIDGHSPVLPTSRKAYSPTPTLLHLLGNCPPPTSFLSLPS